ncbi:hypothetical protein RDWZM_009817 [Blomia tropicalis]|uniref:Rad50/SbcC-type AAA domain-containing protein n=1 Tax=Blomia tropicalis TaxID=40697 RepID=A0A9Q0M799_BLOTA|nr:hypothetical protein RDWZM_009817 [Blomia tropicalis]
MLHLQRLIIQGIRSFNPDEPVDIKFSSLTIFHGPDDVGKTTIIDSLKYALTGNLPPNCDNEECFVHDEQYSKRSMICGQTRLRFIDTQNKSTDITRNLRLFSSKQNNQTTIRFIQDDAIISQDNNPIGVNNEALKFWSFEISRVVLDYIIFCHQEETNWPLSDGKVLKKRFDDIFGSISYKEEVTTNIAKSEEYSCKLRKLTAERNSLILKVKNKSSKLDSIIEKLNNRSNLNQKDCDLILEHFQFDIHSCEDEIKMKKSGINTNLISLKQDLDSLKNKKSNAIHECDIWKKQLSETKLNLYEIENLPSCSSVSHVHEHENIVNDLEKVSVLELQAERLKRQAESLKLQGELCGQIIELLNKVAVLEEQAKHCTIQIESLEKQFEAMQNELKQFERKKQIEIDQCENTIVKLTSLFESINSYVEKLNDSKFKSSQKYIEELDEQILKLEKEKKSIVSEISKMSQAKSVDIRRIELWSESSFNLN